jgi:hypothetical protein
MALQDAMSRAEDIERLFEVWERNVETVRAIHKVLATEEPGYGKRLVTHLKSCAMALVKPRGARESAAQASAEAVQPSVEHGARIDKSVLTIGTIKRHRSREHLRFVAQQPALSAGAHRPRRIMSDMLSRRASDLRSVTSSLFRYVRFITPKIMRQEMNDLGGTDIEWIP